MTGRPPYLLNVTRWEQDHPGWCLAPAFEAVGWRARRKHGPGGWVTAGSLDELAKVIDEQGDLPA